jgi:hypothetical protein
MGDGLFRVLLGPLSQENISAFAEESASFIKESIATWQNDPDPNNIGDPIGVTYGPNGEYQFGKSRPQVYQYLSTRNVGEVISGDAY